MTERLDKICLPPPPADTPWSNRPDQAAGLVIDRRTGEPVQLELPLFWYDPPWYRIGSESANVIAAATARLGIVVSALRSDLSGSEQPSDFHGDQPSGEGDVGAGVDDDAQPPAQAELLPRIVPYRPERYGICDRDFDGAKIIDVRLVMNRDPSGRFAFPPEQVERWHAALSSAPPSAPPPESGSPVPSASFPPDVVSMDHLSSKLQQLRSLSDTAAVFVSLSGYRLEQELPAIIAAEPDGLILRLDDLQLDGLKLALAVRHARRLIDQLSANMPLTIVPGKITPDDAVKLLALGASAVAIDSWCDELVEEAANGGQSTSAYGYASRKSDASLIELVEDELACRVDRFRGLFSSIQRVDPKQRLASASESWARSLGLRSLSFSAGTRTPAAATKARKS